MSLTETTLTWGALTVYGSRGHDLTIETLTGWEDWDTRSQDVPRPASHGAFDSLIYANAKAVTAGGLIAAPTDRDARLAMLKAGFTPSESLADLTIEHGGVVLTAGARLRRFSVTDEAWGVGVFRWAAQWTCPDPLRYGAWTSASTTYPTASGGLVYPLYPDDVLDFGTPSDAGRVTVTNAGTAATFAQFTVAGPVDASGFEIVEVGSGNVLRFEATVPAGSSLFIDPATGRAAIDGTAFREDYLTRQTLGSIPASASVEYAFSPLGSTTAAQMTAALRPAYW